MHRPSEETSGGEKIRDCPLEAKVRVCSSGAALTEKCRTIPAFVNQIPTDSCIDDETWHMAINRYSGFSDVVSRCFPAQTKDPPGTCMTHMYITGHEVEIRPSADQWRYMVLII